MKLSFNQIKEITTGAVLVKEEDGCIRYDYYFSEKNPDEILLIEKWESKNHQEVHLKQPHMTRLFELKPDFVLSTQIGEFELK